MAEMPFVVQDSAGEPLYKLFKAIKHQVEKGPVDAVQKKAKYTLNDTGLLGDDVEYAPLVSPGPGAGAGRRDCSQCPRAVGRPRSQKLDAVHRLMWAQLGSASIACVSSVCPGHLVSCASGPQASTCVWC